MKYVSEKYEQRLADLAELLVTRRRFAAEPVGQMALFNVVELHPTAEVIQFPEVANGAEA